MVASDIDNTIANLSTPLKNRGVDVSIYPSSLPGDFWASEEALRMYYDAAPIPGAAALLQGLLKNLGGLVYITSRPAAAEFVTRRWLRTHGFPDAPVYFVAGAQGKIAAAESLSVALALEDDPAAVALYSAAGIKVIMPDWPYNRAVSIPGVARVRGVADVGYA